MGAKEHHFPLKVLNVSVVVVYPVSVMLSLLGGGGGGLVVCDLATMIATIDEARRDTLAAEI
jgi:hypothetical protein